MKAFKIPLHIFPVTVVCYIGDKANMRKHCNSLLPKENIEYFGKYDGTSGECWTFRFINDDILIWLREVPNTPYGYSCLAHEIDHAVTHIFDYLGAEREKEFECSAYITQHIFETILIKSK